MPRQRKNLTGFVFPLIGAALVLTACGSSTSSDQAIPAPVASVSSQAAQSAVAAPTTDSGSYITLADYESSKDAYAASDVVLFFNASWCSTCKEARDNLEADLAAIPAGLMFRTKSEGPLQIT